MINTSANSYSLHKWHFPLVWIAVNTFVSPIAIYAGLLATYVVAPWNSGPIDIQAPSDPISLDILRILVFAIIAGLILETPRVLMLRQFITFPLWVVVTIVGLVIAQFLMYQNQESVLTGDWMWPNCLADLSAYLVNQIPLVFPGILQSLVLASKRQRWYFWLIAGSTSYILPLYGFMSCSTYGLLAGSFIAATITVVALPLTLRETYP